MIDLYFSKKENASVRSEDFVKKILQEHYLFDVNQIFIMKDEFGKPYLKDYPAFHFSVSHTKGFIVCGFSDDRIGVDAEVFGRYDPRIVKSYFTPNEQKYLYNDAEEVDKGFIEIWTRKEAYLKWLGKGIEIPPVLFDVLELDHLLTVWEGNYCISVCGSSTSRRGVTIKEIILHDGLDSVGLPAICAAGNGEAN